MLKNFKTQKGTLQKLKNLLEDPSKHIHGTFYKNSYFTRQYLSRPQTQIADIDLTENKLKVTVSARIEPIGLFELENTLDTLVRYEAGDVPGFIPEALADGTNIEAQPMIPEVVTTTKQLYSVDILLLMKDPTITFQEFTIAGTKFTLVNLHNQLDEDFEQDVTLLFGQADMLYMFSHFYDKSLSVRDSKIILDLLMDENITGKVIKGVRLDAESGVSSLVYPYEELISCYFNQDGDYIFGMGAGYVKIPKNEIDNFKMELLPEGFAKGHYILKLSNNKSTVRLYME